MRRPESKALLAAGLAACLVAGAAAAPTAPQLSGTLTRNAGVVAGQQRSYLLYVPKSLRPAAPLLLVLHGGGGDGAFARKDTFGYAFDRLADRDGFVVVYPDGIGRSWNTCRRAANGLASRTNADDVAFLEAIIAEEARRHGIDVRRVFITGHSNGGQLAFRFALERPREIAGIAAISSSLPTERNMKCKASGVAVPVMIVNGTADPVNPYDGGTNRRTSNQGPVLSTPATAAYWVRVNGLDPTPRLARLPHRNPSDPTWVERSTWSGEGRPSVILYTIHRGGHGVPQPYVHFPASVGRQTEDLDAPAVIWDFFSTLPAP